MTYSYCYTKNILLQFNITTLMMHKKHGIKGLLIIGQTLKVLHKNNIPNRT